jgi:hypothetical protein
MSGTLAFFARQSARDQLNEQRGTYRHSGTVEAIQEPPASRSGCWRISRSNRAHWFIDDDGQVFAAGGFTRSIHTVCFLLCLVSRACVITTRPPRTCRRLPDLCRLAAGDSREPTWFWMKTAVRSASNRERLRSVNDCVERCACQSPMYKRRSLTSSATRYMDTSASRGWWLRERHVSCPSVRPAISYSRDVTDFTGRRANEKLVGCEVGARAETTSTFPSASPTLASVIRTPSLDSRGVRSLLSDISSYRQLPWARHSGYPARNIVWPPS